MTNRTERRLMAVDRLTIPKKETIMCTQLRNAARTFATKISTRRFMKTSIFSVI